MGKIKKTRNIINASRKTVMPRLEPSIPPYRNNDDRPKAFSILKNNKPKANETEIKITLNKFDLK